MLRNIYLFMLSNLVPLDLTFIIQIEDDMEWNDPNDDTKEDVPYTHIWLKFGQIKGIYPVDRPQAKVTEQQLENEDHDRWVELPDDFMETRVKDSITDLNDIIVIERKQDDGTWPRTKNN